MQENKELFEVRQYFDTYLEKNGYLIREKRQRNFMN